VANAIKIIASLATFLNGYQPLKKIAVGFYTKAYKVAKRL
jgi:hypothetical protein